MINASNELIQIKLVFFLISATYVLIEKWEKYILITHLNIKLCEMYEVI